MQIQIGDALGAWLQEMAAKAGKTPDEYASEALHQFLEDREDYEDAVEAARDAGPYISFEEVIRKYGLEDELQQESGEAVRGGPAKREGASRRLPSKSRSIPA
jgi:predicted transcriptional regulator